MDAAAAYPHAWCRQAHTRDGTPYFIRPIRPDDAERERRFIAGLSPDSLHNRFLGGLREPSPAFIHRLVDVDYDRTMAFVAVVGEGDDERIIGVARYAANPSSSDCEFAVTVADEWQSRGIGTTLARLLFDYARARGFRRTYGYILAGNDRMVSLARWIGLQVRAAPDDATLLEASMPLQTPPVNPPAAAR